MIPTLSRRPAFGARVAVAMAIAVALAGCGIPTKQQHPTLRDDVPLAGVSAPARAGWPSAEWWRQYNDPQLDDLIARAMKDSPDLAQAMSRVNTAEQNIRITAAQAGLSVNGSAQVARQRLSETGLIPPKFLGFTWYNQGDIGVQAQYDFDWWGKKRAGIEAAVDQAHAAEAQRSAAALTIQNAVADTYFGWLADEARIALAREQVGTQDKLTRVAELRVHQGIDLPDDAQKARTQQAAAREMLVALEGSAKIRLAALASLVGVAPADLPTLQPRALPTVDAGLPANVGIDLIARRPDIAASRWQVEAALKQTDVARAEFFPDISISAMAGLSSIDLDKVFNASSRVMSLTPALHLPIFNNGLLQANFRASQAQLDAAVAQYNSTILSAARDVSTQSLTAQQIEARRKEQATQISANERLVVNAQARARQGVRDVRETLGAQAQLLQQRDDAVSLQAQALSTDLSLIKALGGGYQMPTSPAGAADAQAASPSPSNTPAGDADHERH
ncbi:MULTISPECIES: efflux transporter outer membrane subunit [Dyella]|uniref:Efflux transporter outer membrane subunit n=2 Tax=Dyella TaxID=231454 RepID=A0A4R0Z0H8_9GAMM|nr:MULTISPECIES: efflux transporter outer membrane subunit [Dyella]TBR39154.1 efflux transporter outer membrane subunit [Dyella terrae]TCI13259.1 efflux transporter outer membrane subunit [Dyella soli]